MSKTTPKKIIFVHLLNDFSGSPKVLSQVIKTAQLNGVEVELFTGNRTAGFLSDSTKNHHYFIYKRFENKYLTLVSFAFSQFVLFFKLLQYWRKDADIYVNTMLPFGAGLAGWVMRKRIIYHIHETYIKPQVLKTFLRKIIQITSSELVFVSKSVKTLESFNKKKQTIIYNSLPTAYYTAGNDHLYTPIKSEKFNVLMISSMKAYKGIFEFIDLAKTMKHLNQFTFTLVFNAKQNDIASFFTKTTIPSNVLMMDKQSDVTPFYKNASLVLNLSRFDECIETFGLTILEALSFGIPVIVPPVGGPSELIHDGKEGFLISSYETLVIAQKIEDLFNNPEQCMELSINAKNRALEFNENTFNKEIMHVLQA
mgnify:CR=1 FL=1